MSGDDTMPLSDRSTNALATRGSALLREYVEQGRTRTDLVRELAEIVVELRSRYTLTDGRTDWSGRSTEYRSVISGMYQRAGVPVRLYGNIQAVMHYHVGNLVRERAGEGELVEVGIRASAPRERLRRARDIAYAVNSATKTERPRTDPLRLLAHAETVLGAVTPPMIRGMDEDDRADARQTLARIIAQRDALAAALAPATVTARRGHPDSHDGSRSDR